MPPKKNSGKKPKKSAAPEIDWASPVNFRPNEPIVYAEIDPKCYVFQEQFERFMGHLQLQFPKTTFRTVVNSPIRLGEVGPRNGSFEISIAQNARCPEEPMWSGVDSGPPRRMKFSGTEYEELWPAVQKIVTRVYVPPDVVEKESAEEMVENGGDGGEVEASE